MNDKQKEFLKYINGIKYLLFDRKSTVNAADILIPNKVKDLCEKYLIPINKPFINTRNCNQLMLLQNDPDAPKYGYHVDFRDFISAILKRMDITPRHITDDEEVQFLQAVYDTLIHEGTQPNSPSSDMLPLLNGYFDRNRSTFIQDEVPEMATGCAETTYIDFSDGDSSKLKVYDIIKSLMEDNPTIAEELFHALADEANESHTIIGQFYAAVCDGQPYMPCKGCHANKKTDCQFCSRNRTIRDMYKA